MPSGCCRGDSLFTERVRLQHQCAAGGNAFSAVGIRGGDVRRPDPRAVRLDHPLRDLHGRRGHVLRRRHRDEQRWGRVARPLCDALRRREQLHGGARRRQRDHRVRSAEDELRTLLGVGRQLQRPPVLQWDDPRGDRHRPGRLPADAGERRPDGLRLERLRGYLRASDLHVRRREPRAGTPSNSTTSPSRPKPRPGRCSGSASWASPRSPSAAAGRTASPRRSPERPR